MSPKTASSDAINSLLRPYPQLISELTHRLRALILEVVPAAEEWVRPGWQSLSYHHPVMGYVCGLFPRETAVQLVLEYGILLPDPERLLTGEGKQVRVVLIEQAADIRPEPLRALLAAALDLPEKRNDRLAMIATRARPRE